MAVKDKKTVFTSLPFLYKRIKIYLKLFDAELIISLSILAYSNIALGLFLLNRYSLVLNLLLLLAFKDNLQRKKEAIDTDALDKGDLLPITTLFT